MTMPNAMDSTLVSTDRRTAKERIASAFMRIRRDGFAARASFMCCDQHGFEQIKKQYPAATGYVFYHQQAERLTFNPAGNFITGKALRLAFSKGQRARFASDQACGAAIVDALRSENLAVHWNGEGTDKIHVMALETIA